LQVGADVGGAYGTADTTGSTETTTADSDSVTIEVSGMPAQLVLVTCEQANW